MTTWVDPGDVQGNVLRSYGSKFNHTRYIFLEFDKPLDEPGKTALVSWLGQVSFGTPRPQSARNPCRHEETRPERVVKGDGEHGEFDSSPKLNLAFTYKGLEQLGLPGGVLNSFPLAFREGAAQRAPDLEDQWHQDASRFRLDESHLLVTIHRSCADGDQKRCARECDQWCRMHELDDAGPFHVKHVLDAVRSNQRREGFGFRDGFSQPAIEGVNIDAVGRGAYVGTEARGGVRRRVDLLLENLSLESRPRGWRPLRTGQFLLGYENESGELPIGPASPWGPNGTFMVYREFDQEVDLFDEFVSTSATAHGVSEDVIRAKIVGRWTDGTPAIRPRPDDIVGRYPCRQCGADAGKPCVDEATEASSYHRPRVEAAAKLGGLRSRLNDLLYGNDPRGWGCPLGAHVRRSNPRDALPGGGEETMRHRIIRRGTPFVVTDGNGGVARQGLAFVCLSSSIEDGFEFIQRNWINNGAAFGLGSAPDFLLHNPNNRQHARMVIPGFRPIILSPPHKPFVTVRACEYLFVPSRVACLALEAFLRL